MPTTGIPRSPADFMKSPARMPSPPAYEGNSSCNPYSMEKYATRGMGAGILPVQGSGRFSVLGRAAPAAGDQAGAPLPRAVRPCPFEEHEEAVPEADQEGDVHAEPGQPGGQPREPEGADDRDRGGAAHGGHAAAVAVAEGARGFAGQATPGIGGRRPPLLDRHRGHAGKRLARAVGEGAEIAGHEDLRMPGHREGGRAGDASGPAQRRAQRVRPRGRPPPRPPEPGPRGERTAPPP